MSPSLDSVLATISLPSPTLLPADTCQQVLRFALGSDSAMLPLAQITEIFRVDVMQILPVPETPNSILGVCNWRGDMLWLVDLDSLVGYPSLVETQQEQESLAFMAMVLQVDDQAIGLGVRQVYEIEHHELQNLKPVTPGLFPPRLQPFVLGVIPGCRGAVLDIAAIMQRPLWQNLSG
ncbi:chemotaxis protein CheW [Phormidium tenue FACHB-886]|nr:chemotaxis protein CheW [Phormidium tenue FACHB-886]